MSRNTLVAIAVLALAGGSTALADDGITIKVEQFDRVLKWQFSAAIRSKRLPV
jgi:hypothetical protein